MTAKETQPTELNKAPEQSTSKAHHVDEVNSGDSELSKEATIEEKVDAKFEVQSLPSNETEAKIDSAKTKHTDKKSRPEKLDIAAAKGQSETTVDVGNVNTGAAKASTKDKAEGSNVIEPTEAATPATTVLQASATSAIRQSQPRAVRVPPTSKAETSSPGMGPSSKQASRRPSLTSSHPPGTPADEKMSDNVSLTSTSMSRANSPPPSKVGSAPVRQVTKSQQKKERQARAKQAEGLAKAEEPAPKIEEVQAPIIGRKKKTKKERTQGTADSTPTVTRPTSPVPKEEVVEEKVTPGPITPNKENKKGQTKIMADIKEPETPSSPATPAGEDKKASPTAASIIGGLLRNGEISASALDMFKTPAPGLNHRIESIEPDFPEIDFPTEEQLRLLDQGEAIAVEQGPNHHVIVLPDRRVVPGLTADQASRYLDLRKRAIARGEVPVQLALDSMVPNPPWAAPLPHSSMSHGKGPKKLINKFADPISPSDSSRRYGAAGLRGHDGPAGTAGDGTGNKKPKLSGAELEQNLAASRKEIEALEKRLNAIMKKNKRIMLGGVH